MKKFIWLITIMTLPFFSLAQLMVDAGTDTTLCVTAQGQVLNGMIGGSPTVLGGTAPYTYTWEIEYYVGGHLFTASYFLNDTTIANPTVVHDVSDPSILFHVTVTDANGSQGVDSILISFSRFGILPITNHFSMTEGDTTAISISVGGGTPPYNYAWYPNYNISDTTVAMPLVWPQNDTFYFCAITDALGCPFTFNNIATVEVWAVSTKKTLIKDLKIYPNPTQDYLIIELEKGEIQHISITDMSGKVVLQQSEVLNNQIDIRHLISGIYVLVVEDEKDNVGSFQVVKQ